MSITGVAGTPKAGAQITISGSGFGTKSSAQPLYFSDFDSSMVGQTAMQAGLDALQYASGMLLPYVRNDRAYSGSQSLRMDYPLNMNSYFPMIGKDSIHSTEIYVSAWSYWTRSQGTGVGTLPIFKWSRGGSYPVYHGDPAFYETIRPDPTGAIIAVDRGFTISTGNTINCDAMNALQSGDSWHRADYYYRLSTPGVSDGAFQQWVDQIVNVNRQNVVTRPAGSSALIDYVMTPYDGLDSYGNANAYQFWLDDIYIDTTQARVELADAPAWSARTVSQIQPATSWSGNAISIDFRPVSFQSGQTAYLYVIDANGNVNANGYPVQIP